MKEILLVALLVLINGVFYAPVSAADKTTEAVIKEQCDGYSAEGNYEYGFSCDGGEDIFYIDGKQVSKKDFDIKKTNYDLRGDVCTETVKSTTVDLPKDFSASCKKGEYGKYFYKGNSVTYKEFMLALFGIALDQAIKDTAADQIEQLTKEKKLLKSYKSFVKAFAGKDYYGFISQYAVPKVGSDCSEGEHILINKTGYEIAECVEGAAVTINYFWQGKKMTLDKYIKAIYKSEKSANLEMLKALKKK
jgi:hypothetical protein